MASERTLKPVSQLLVANGTINGILTVASSKYFKVKAKVVLRSNTQPTISLEVKSVPNKTTIIVGPCGDILARTDVSMYTVADNASVKQDAQKRPAIAQGDIDRFTFSEEPTVARRVVQVDEFGDIYGSDNPLPVSAELSVENLDISLTAHDNVPHPGDIHDSIRIGDGTNELKVNTDGSINVDVSGMSGATNPFILNTPVPLANTEYSVTLPQAVKKFLLRMRNSSKFHLSYVVGTTMTNYITINCGVVYAEGDLSLTSPLVLYFNSAKNSEVVEILYCTKLSASVN